MTIYIDFFKEREVYVADGQQVQKAQALTGLL